MLEDELHQSAAGDTPPEPEAKESDAAVPAEETGENDGGRACGR